MRIRHTTLVVAVAASLLVLVPSTAAQTPQGDSVTGDLFDQIQTGTSVFGIDARSGPSGQNPSGTANWHVGGGLGPTWNATVTCLSATGNTAVVGFTGTVRFFGMDIPVAGLFRVVDGGGPISGLDRFEWAEVEGVEGGPPISGPTDCSTYPSVFTSSGTPAFNRTNGNLVVTDTVPRPTTKDQCKNDRWRLFGVFKSEGDCVSFVATNGKNQPSGP